MISPKIWHCIHPFFRNYGPVSTPSSYCIGYSVIKDTVSSYFTKYTLCSGIIDIHLMQEVDVLLRNHCVLLSVNDKGRTSNPVHLEETLSNMVNVSLVSLETEKLDIGFGFPKQFFL